MESSPKFGCTIRNQKDPYRIQCVFSTDPIDKRDFSVYFNSPDGGQELMVSCAHNERYECFVTQQGLMVTEDYITVSETFSKQNGSFVCRNGGPPLDKFPCFYSGNSVKSEVKYGTIENGSNTFLKPEDFGTQDSNNAAIVGAVLGVVVIILCLVVFFLLVDKYKSKKERKASKDSRSSDCCILQRAISNVDNGEKSQLEIEKEASGVNKNQIDEKWNSRGEPAKNKNCNQINRDITNSSSFIVNEAVPENANNASDDNHNHINEMSNLLSSDDAEPNECSQITGNRTNMEAFVKQPAGAL